MGFAGSGFDAVKLVCSFQSQLIISDQTVEIENCVFPIKTILTFPL